MKKFFDKIKKDYKYKKAGSGRRLDEERVVTPQSSSTSTGSTGSASRENGTSAANAQAAAAAIARLEKKMMPKSASSMNKATLRAAREQNAAAKQGDKALVDSLQPPAEKKDRSRKNFERKWNLLHVSIERRSYSEIRLRLPPGDIFKLSRAGFVNGNVRGKAKLSEYSSRKSRKSD